MNPHSPKLHKPRIRPPDWLDYLICLLMLAAVILIVSGAIHLFFFWNPRML
jgi:hypothetical protein